jgi:prolyl 4-hydroxylase
MGNRLQNISITSKLFCRFHSTNFFTKISPFKLEIVNNNPFVGIFHDVISDDEIETFKGYASAKLQRAEVMNIKSKNVVSTNRVAKLGFLYESQDQTKTLKKVSERVSDMSGLSVKTGEFLFYLKNFIFLNCVFTSSTCKILKFSKLIKLYINKVVKVKLMKKFMCKLNQ